MSNGKFAWCLVGGIAGAVALGFGVQSALNGVVGRHWADLIGSALSGGCAGALGAWLVRSGNRQSERRRLH